MLLFLVGCSNNNDTSLKCSNCGEAVAVDTKFCPQCGETILDGSDDNNNDEHCSHSWEVATCTDPKTCSKCGETDGNALGHTTSIGFCERCHIRQGWTKEEVQSLVKVYSVFVDEINSAGGVNMKIAFENTSSKTIKYIYFTVEAYNAVDDKVYCEIRNYNKFTGYLTGPLESGYSSLVYDADDDVYYADTYWENCYYNSDISYFVLNNIRIVYMDNTEIEINEDYVDYAFTEMPQGLYYTWNSEYNGYEVNYRLKKTCTATNISIPSTYNGNKVVSIANKGFRNISSLTSITLPDTIRHIGDSAFASCTSLTTIEIPNGVTNIGEDAFYYCSRLKSILMPKSVSSIGYMAFYGCNNIESITVPFVGKTEDGDTSFDYIFGYSLPDSLKKVTITGGTVIGAESFSGCGGLSDISLPNTILRIERNAFENCVGIVHIDLPNSINYIGDRAFQGCSNLASITIPDEVTEINSYVFYNCSNLIDVNLNRDLKIINSGAFYNCTSIVDITIPNRVVSIGEGAFSNCSNIESITLPFVGARKNGSEDTYFAYIFGSTYLGSPIPSTLKNVTLTSSDFIDDGAFNGCYSLVNISIPNSVFYIGEDAFYDCENIETIIVENGNTTYHCKDNCLIETETNTLILGSKKSIIPNYVTSISSYAFCNLTNLISIVVPNNITSIGHGAFYGCASLESMTLPFIGSCLDDEENPNFGYIFGGEDYSYDVAYFGNSYIPSTLTSVTITGGTFVGENAFRGCSYITNIKLPNTITSIATRSFYGCKNLTELDIPISVNLIGRSAFEGCTSLTTINIPSNVTNISQSLFEDCSNLTSIIISDNVTAIGISAFSGCSSLVNVSLGNSLSNIGAFSFSGCTSLKNITIPNSVNKIGKSAFDACPLASVIFENTSGWWYSWSSSTSSRDIISSSSLADYSKAATLLKDTYRSYDWLRI